MFQKAQPVTDQKLLDKILSRVTTRGTCSKQLENSLLKFSCLGQSRKVGESNVKALNVRRYKDRLRSSKDRISPLHRPPFIILIVQSIAGDWGTWVSDAWSWLLPTILPTLTLIFSSVLVEATNEHVSLGKVNAFAYCICLGFSAFYLLCVSALAHPIPSANDAHRTHSRELGSLTQTRHISRAYAGAFPEPTHQQQHCRC
jgi:hypothetical protein